MIKIAAGIIIAYFVVTNFILAMKIFAIVGGIFWGLWLLKKIFTMLRSFYPEETKAPLQKSSHIQAYLHEIKAKENEKEYAQNRDHKEF